MITKEEIKNLASLARIELDNSEVESLTKEVDSILAYVGQIQEVSAGVDREIPKNRNIMRDDVVTNEPGQYTSDILTNTPVKTGEYVSVKKIL